MEDTATAFFVAIIIALFVIYGVGIGWFAYDLRRPLSNGTFRRYLKKLGLRDVPAQLGNPETRELETLVTEWRRVYNRISIGAGIGGLSFMLCALPIALTLPVSNGVLVAWVSIAFVRALFTIYIFGLAGAIGVQIGRIIATRAVLGAILPEARREPVEGIQPPLVASSPRSLWKRLLWFVPLVNASIITLVACTILIMATRSANGDWSVVIPYLALFCGFLLAATLTYPLEGRQRRASSQLVNILRATAPHLPAEAVNKLTKAIGMVVIGVGMAMLVSSMEISLLTSVVIFQPTFHLQISLLLPTLAIFFVLAMISATSWPWSESAAPQPQPHAPAANGPAV